MISYLMKIIGGVLAVLLLVFVPLVSYICVDEIALTRENWNQLENYIDIVCDKGLLTKEDYDRFILKLNKNGIIYDVNIEILRKIALPESNGTAKITYQLVGFYTSSPNEEYQILDNTKVLLQGDIVNIKCIPINKTTGQLMMSNLTNINRNNQTLSLSNMVRNKGVGDIS